MAKKRLFIEQLEERQSTAPLMVAPVDPSLVMSTMIAGEEGGHGGPIMTTMSVGEEGGHPPIPPITTDMVGEEGGHGPITTMVWGEEGALTTHMVGEEGGMPRV
ncbi:MAG: hypothetical protein IMX06_06840 [Kyrpidia tusciae]|nr:hypothetical protein [Kyrpidia tusciae]MBE3552561.1 hypothetical protein [Kyrpidia tusciae]